MRSRLLTSLALATLVLAGCAKAKPEAATVEKAASVVPIPGTDRVQVRLTADAVRRLDLKTGTIQDLPVTAPPAAPAAAAAAGAPAPNEADVPAAAKGAKAPAPAPAPPPLPPPAPPAVKLRRVIPFAAILYAPSGDAFTYVNVGPQLYERTPVKVDYVSGESAVLGGGPPEPPAPGTVVVTVGGPELSGAEFGVGE